MISYIGGKANISKWIKKEIPTDIETYVEPFGGMFWLYYKMDITKYPNLKTIVYNDFNKLNTNLFKNVKNYKVLNEELKKYPFQQYGQENTPELYKEMFYQYQKEVFNPELIITEENSLEIACKYVYVLTQVFSGNKPGTSKYMDYKGKYKCKLQSFINKLNNPKFQSKIDRITFITNKDFEDVIKEYDSKKTYFYVDPPYWKTENYYSNHDFNRDDHERLINTLKSVEGRYGLSYYEFPLLSEWFNKTDYRWEQKEFVKAASAKEKKNKSTEILILNYGMWM